MYYNVKINIINIVVGLKIMDGPQHVCFVQIVLWND